MAMLGKATNKTVSIDEIRARTGVYLVLAGFSFVLNATFLVVLARNKNIVKRKRITYHVANLALSDSLVGSSTLIYFLHKEITSTETLLSKAFVVITWTTTLTSLLAVCLMAIERAVAIRNPHTWTQILPLKRIFLAMLGNWLLTLPLAVVMNFYTLEMRFALLVLFYIPVCVTSVVYAVVYWGLWREKRNAIRDNGSSPSIKEIRNKLLHRKVGSFVLMLTLVLIITVSPSFLCLAVKTACELFNLKCKFIDTVTYLSHYLYMLEISNFVVNPIFYVWRMSLYRKAFWRMFNK